MSNAVNSASVIPTRLWLNRQAERLKPRRLSNAFLSVSVAKVVVRFHNHAQPLQLEGGGGGRGGGEGEMWHHGGR